MVHRPATRSGRILFGPAGAREPRRAGLLRARAGYTVVEVLTVTAMLGLLSAFVLPHVVYARMRANETAAQEVLRQIYQEELQLSLIPALDQDQDGRGEHGFLGRGVLDQDAVGAERGILERNGYAFEIWLPDEEGRGLSLLDAELGRPPGADAAERHWCCYAWPIRPGLTGRFVYFINEHGTLLQRDVEDAPPKTTSGEDVATGNAPSERRAS